MDAGYGTRQDNTQKGRGFFGEIKRPDGSVSTEISIGVTIDNKQVEIPLIVPTLNRRELDYLIRTPVESRQFMDRMPKSIIEKAYDHAVMRLQTNKSPFAGPDELTEPPR
jgi:hypothetical protein